MARRNTMVDPDQGHGTAVAVRKKTRTKPPARYKVLLHNDHYTAMDFVVSVLQVVFHHPHEVAQRIMLQIHQRGIGVAGLYPHEIAETKANKVVALARAAEFPLQCSIEKE